MEDNISSERQRNSATQTTPESNQAASSASPSPTCSPSSLLDGCVFDGGDTEVELCIKFERRPEFVGSDRETVRQQIVQECRELILDYEMYKRSV